MNFICLFARQEIILENNNVRIKISVRDVKEKKRKCTFE